MRLIAVFSLSLCLLGCSASQAPAPVIMMGDKTPDRAGIHMVRVGDSVYSIAQRYKLSMRGLIQKNNLSAPYTIDVGQRLILPPPATYTVKPGDSLYTISRAFGVDTTRLARLNDIGAPYKIYPGKTLRLPDSGVAVQTPAPKASVPQTRTASVQKPLPQSITQTPASSGRFAWPVRGRVISNYGPKAGGLHNDGINIAGRRGEAVGAAENGVVVYAGDQIQGFGNLVLLRHENRYMTAYAHLDRITVTRGQSLSKGTEVGKLGSTGNVDSPQLHFEIRRGTKAIDPRQYL